MKKLVSGVLASCFIFLTGCGTASIPLGSIADEAIPLTSAPTSITESSLLQASNSVAKINYTDYSSGYFLAYWLGGDAKVKVLVKTPLGNTYQYNLRSDGQPECFPFSEGEGKYSICIYKNINGTQYSMMLSEKVDVKFANAFAPFLGPNQYINYEANSNAVKKATELCSNATTNLERVQAIYSYVIDNISYDKAKAQSVKSGYLPNVDETLATGKGICFDYAALMTAMLRSQNVPTKLIIGYTGNAYHAWINVWDETGGWMNATIYFNGNEWKLMDPTFASNSNESAAIMAYIGNGSNYQAKYQY